MMQRAWDWCMWRVVEIWALRCTRSAVRALERQQCSARRK